jgi:hypothetical protein
VGEAGVGHARNHTLQVHRQSSIFSWSLSVRVVCFALVVAGCWLLFVAC